MADAAMDIRIHPLVVLHIADHYTRVVQQTGQTRVLGAIMGQQVGRVVNVVDAFDIAYVFNEKEKSANLKDSKDFTTALQTFDGDRNLFKATFPQYEVLGWYATGSSIDPLHAAIHKQMKQFNERPLFFLVDNKLDPNARDLPLQVYDEVIHVSGDKVTTEFVQTPYKVESEEAERVTAVHCAKVINQVDGSASTVAPHYGTLKSSVQTLNQRLKVVHTYLKETQANKVKTDHAILRQIKGLVNRLPAASGVDFKSGFISEYNDALLVAYLASITKSIDAANNVVDKFNLTFQQRRRAPMFFG